MKSFAVRYLAGLAIIAALDGAVLSGVAAIITSIGGIILGVLAYKRGAKAAAEKDPWKIVAEERGRDNDRLRREIRVLRGGET